MFTGLVAGLADVLDIQDEPPGKRLVVRMLPCDSDPCVGDSVAVNGCCLTVVEFDPRSRATAFEAGPETLARTNLGVLSAGSRVNIETSLRLGDPLGGHLVTGHIDCVGHLDQRLDDEAWSTFWFRLPRAFSRQLASKGSIAVDGVSLTLVEVEAARFSVALIPHTLDVTTLGQLEPDDAVNLETDLLAKYVERQLVARDVPVAESD